MAGQSAATARATGFRVLTGAAIALLAGCGENGGAGGGAGAAGGGGGGAPVEGCVDIHADERSLPEPGTWRRVPGNMALQPFWVDERGVHYVWTANELGTSQAYLVVSTFDRETGAAIDNRFYEAFPPELSYSATSIYDAAGSPEGAFAALISYSDDSAPWGVVEPVVLGHLDEPGVTVWQPSWSVEEAGTLHVGWDGEAFAVHAWSQTGPEVRLARLAPDGTVLTPETAVGAITTFWPDESVFLTDAGSGKSWMVSHRSAGTWLSGHERDGTPFPGTEVDGGVLLEFYDWGLLGLATVGEHALVAGSGPDDTRLQPLFGTELSGDLVVLPHDESFYGTRKTLAADGVGWWMGMLQARTGIHSYRLGPGGEVLAESPLIPYTTCSESCFGELLNVHLFSTARFEDELWFGFLDATDSFTVSPEHPASHEPFRIVKVKDGCIYLTEYETNNSPD